MKTSKTRNMIYVSLGAVIMALSAWITVPFAIPFTLQTFALFLILELFGAKNGLVSIIVYIALGFIGLPVFSGFNSGLGALISPAGGFIIGFFGAGCAYLALKSFLNKNFAHTAVLSFIALAACYGCGVGWYMLYFERGVGFITAVTVCVVPYILPDVLKIILAQSLAKKLKKFISL